MMHAVYTGQIRFVTVGMPPGRTVRRGSDQDFGRAQWERVNITQTG